ncbi:MAG TPA: AI-2E family transporter [Bryobacteraceae bacterium]|nr:AI-2E family transporter [Bryobacteraceae bacterium]
MQVETPQNDMGWFSRERLLMLALGLATLLGLYTCFLIVQPFISPIAIAVALAEATNSVTNWMRRRLKSNTGAATLSLLLVACLIVVPLSFLISYVVRQIIAAVKPMTAAGGGGIPDLRSLLHLPPAAAGALDWVQAHLDLQAQLTRLGQSVASQAGDLLAGSVNVVVQLMITLFVLFFLYRDRDEALSVLRSLVPLSEQEASRLFARTKDTLLAIVNGSIIVAFVQAMLAGVMYTALGVPLAAIWASLTFVVALIPVFGTFMVWGPVAAFLLLSGSWGKAAILVGWGALAVGTIDNILYPYLVGDRMRMHTLPAFFAILGGVAVFGPAGLILGPVALAVTLGLLDVWWWRTAGGRTAEQAVAVNSLRAPPV